MIMGATMEMSTLLRRVTLRPQRSPQSQESALWIFLSCSSQRKIVMECRYLLSIFVLYLFLLDLPCSFLCTVIVTYKWAKRRRPCPEFTAGSNDSVADTTVLD